MEHTHLPNSPWWIVEAVDKKKARLNCIHHLLSQIPYQGVEHQPITLPDRVHNPNYTRVPLSRDMYVPNIY
jgi:hypothetical protein